MILKLHEAIWLHPALNTLQQQARCLEEFFTSPPKQILSDRSDALVSLPHKSAEVENPIVQLPWSGQFTELDFSAFLEKLV